MRKLNAMYSFGQTEEESNAVLVFTGRLEVTLIASISEQGQPYGSEVDDAIRLLGRDPVISLNIRTIIINADLKDKFDLNRDNSPNTGLSRKSPIWDALMTSDIFTPFYKNLFQKKFDGSYDFSKIFRVLSSIIMMAESEEKKLRN
jgi:hypothetical protein